MSISVIPPYQGCELGLHLVIQDVNHQNHIQILDDTAEEGSILRNEEEGAARGSLSEEQKLKFQQKISHYLKGHRLRNNLTGEDLAGIMGLSIATFRALEGSKPVGRMVNSLEFLASLYSLEEGMSLADFVVYLDSADRENISAGHSLKRKLFPWEKHLLGAFDKLGMLLRREFVNDICVNEPLEKYIDLNLKLKRLDESEFKVIEDMVDAILKYKDISMEESDG